MIKTFHCSDSRELDDIINFYLETNHFQIIDSSHKVLELDKKPLFTLAIKPKAGIVATRYHNGQIKCSSLPEKDYDPNDDYLIAAKTFYYSPKMDHKVMLDREYNYGVNGNYVEWYEDSGNILKWVYYYEHSPQWYWEWYEDSDPETKNGAIKIPSYNPEDYDEEKLCGSGQQIKIKGQFKDNEDTHELEKDGEWIKWNDSGEKILNVLYKDGKIKDVVNKFYYDSDPLPCYEDYHQEKRDCGDCAGEEIIKWGPDMVNYDHPLSK